MTEKNSQPDLSGELPVYITYYNDWDFPANWGCISFADEDVRDEYVTAKRTCLFVIYLEDEDHPDHHRIMGLYKVEPEALMIDDVISDAHKEYYTAKHITIEDIYTLRAPDCWSVIGRRPMLQEIIEDPKDLTAKLERSFELNKTNLEKLAQLTFAKEKPYQDYQIRAATSNTPSKAGPQNLGGFLIPEREDGPKETYILKLDGAKGSDFSGNAGETTGVFKVGLSGDPVARMHTLNSTFPGSKYVWRLHKGRTISEGNEYIYKDFASAKEAEDAMKLYLQETGESLGNEFFAANDKDINEAWKKASEV